MAGFLLASCCSFHFCSCAILSSQQINCSRHVECVIITDGFLHSIILLTGIHVPGQAENFAKCLGGFRVVVVVDIVVVGAGAVVDVVVVLLVVVEVVVVGAGVVVDVVVV